jgi:hypothetical protein
MLGHLLSGRCAAPLNRQQLQQVDVFVQDL